MIKFVFMLCMVSTLAPAFGAPKPFRVTEQAREKISQAIPETMQLSIEGHRNVLVLTKCSGFVHGSIPAGKALLEEIQKKYPQLKFTFSDDIESFSSEYLSSFDLFLNLNATHISKTFSPENKLALLDYVKKGGRFMGIHAASDSGSWPEYTDMIGGCFDGHPWTARGEWDFKVVKTGHPTCQCFEHEKFSHQDEIYRHKDVADDMEVLVKLDEKSQRNINLKKKGKEYIYEFKKEIPVSWTKSYGKGKVFYTSFGHNNETYWKKEMVEHYLSAMITLLK
jgi:type 1 glutamine amidotransferase